MGKKPSRSTAIILIVAVGLLIAYPLSAGPAVALLGALGPDEHPLLVNFFGCVYDLPLGALPGPLVDLLQWWVDLWDVYGIVTA
jgi:hypothetical protein